MNSRLYGFASPAGLDTGLVRFGGIGLGNLLFSWARCAVFCKRMGATQIYTTWPQVKPGSWIRWESDKRHYGGMFRPLSDEVCGLNKLLALSKLQAIDERHWKTASQETDQVVVFRGLARYFLDISAADEYGWLRKRFFEMIRDQGLAQREWAPHIGVHIRRGDMPGFESRSERTGNMQLPLAWYRDVIERLSAETGRSLEIGVCSDGTEQELAELFKLPHVRFVKGRNSLEDFLYLANSRLLVGSCSTFSQWAAYLSGRPSIWHPVFERSGGLGNGSMELEVGENKAPDRVLWQEMLAAGLREIRA